VLGVERAVPSVVGGWWGVEGVLHRGRWIGRVVTFWEAGYQHLSTSPESCPSEATPLDAMVSQFKLSAS